MDLLRRNPGSAWPMLIAAMIATNRCAIAVRGQAADDTAQAEPVKSAQSLEARQQAIRDRIQRLESRMVKLSQLLEESEPEKAERLRDALDYNGKHRIKTRVEELVALLREGQLGQADQQQEALLADLDALVTLLTSSQDDADQRRKERQKLEALKRTVRRLMDDQLRDLYRTQQIEQRLQEASGEDNPQHASDLESEMRSLERSQRAIQQKTDETQSEMKPAGPDEQPSPGAEGVERASEHMQQAADRLGEQAPGDARSQQEQAVAQLQNALDELDDSLRQVRREEAEQTLAALEVRLRSMLERERDVRDSVESLAQKSNDQWERTDELRLAAALETQQAVCSDADATLRIVLSEGTTIIVPELLRQLTADMAAIAGGLERSDLSAETRSLLDDTIALLEEMLAAVEQKREELADQDDFQQQAAGSDKTQPLLSGSAELKLLRSTQLRLNDRTAAALREPASEPAAHESALQSLAERQRDLAELARRMHERL